MIQILLNLLYYTRKMSKFFEFRNSIFKRNGEQRYHKSEWEPLRMESFRMLPFQFVKDVDELFELHRIDSEGSETEITDYFFDNNYITGWTQNGGSGTFTASGSDLTQVSIPTSDYIYSNNITLSSGDRVYFKIDGTFNGDDYLYSIYDNTTVKKTVIGQEVDFTYTADTNSSDYTVRITVLDTSNIYNATTQLNNSQIEIYEGANGSDYVSYFGDILYDSNPFGQYYFRNNREEYTDNTRIGCVHNWCPYWYGSTEDLLASSTSILASSVSILASSSQYYATQANERSWTFSGDNIVRSNSFQVHQGETVSFVVNSDDLLLASNLDGSLVHASGSDYFTGTKYGNNYHYTATASYTGSVYVQLTDSVDSTINSITVYKDYSNITTKIKVESAVDFAGIYYRGGFKQWLYKSLDVRRSPESEVVVTADEVNGEQVVQKISTMVTYQARMKVTEHEFDALLTSIPCTVTLTGINGESYEAKNIELDNPTWYNSNGMATLKFAKDINTYTQINDDL